MASQLSSILLLCLYKKTIFVNKKYCIMCICFLCEWTNVCLQLYPEFSRQSPVLNLCFDQCCSRDKWQRVKGFCDSDNARNLRPRILRHRGLRYRNNVKDNDNATPGRLDATSCPMTQCKPLFFYVKKYLTICLKHRLVRQQQKYQSWF